MSRTKKDFEKFYNEHFDKLYRFVYFRTGKDAELAQDLVSEIFMKVLDHFEGYDETKSKTAWLMTIARNHLANFWRDRKPAESLAVLQGDQEGEEREDVWLKGALEDWQKKDAHSVVTDFLAKLSEDEREIVTFHYLFGYSYMEIAEMRGVQEGTVKVAAHRAIKKMRTWL